MARDRVNRAQMRGRPLDADCYKAHLSMHEYVTETHDYIGCYGLVSEPDTPLDKCRKCGAYALGDFYGRVRELGIEVGA